MKYKTIIGLFRGGRKKKYTSQGCKERWSGEEEEEGKKKKKKKRTSVCVLIASGT